MKIAKVELSSKQFDDSLLCFKGMSVLEKIRKIVQVPYMLLAFLLLKVVTYYILIDVNPFLHPLLLGTIFIFWIIFSHLSESKWKHKYAIFMIIYVGLSFLMFADSMYFNYYNQTVSVRQIYQVSNVAKVPQSFIATLIPASIFLIWDIPFASYYFRRKASEEKYAGIFTNPNTFGLYLYVIFAIYMSDLDWNVETGKKFRKAWPTYIQLALVLFYISVSQARTAMLAVCGILILWVILRICLGKTNHKWKETVKGFLLLALITVVCYPVFFAGVRHIPNLIGHPILFEEDVLYLSNGEKIEGIGDKVLAESDAIESVQIPEPKEKKEFKENSILGRLIASLDGNSTLNKISNGRITIYKAYLKKLNWKDTVVLR